jgi:uncharacterized membrane protein
MGDQTSRLILSGGVADNGQSVDGFAAGGRMTGQGRLKYRWRALLGAAVAIAAWPLACAAGLLPGAAGLLAWNLGAVAYLAPTLALLLLSDGERVRREAGRADEGRVVIMAVIVGAVLASLAAIIYALHEGRSGHGGHAPSPLWLLGLSVSSLVLGWIIVQAQFALHYAHRYFGDRDGDGTADKGIQFPGEPPSTYRDFVYVAVCIGATFQVSDFSITDRRFRDLVTAHSAIAFLFNTMVLALGINIFGGLMGQ